VPGESSIEELLIEMYLAGLSVRRVENIPEALWGTRVSPSTVSELNQKVYAQIKLTISLLRDQRLLPLLLFDVPERLESLLDL